MATPKLLRSPPGQLPPHARKEKRHYQHHLSPEPRPEKRMRTEYNFHHFTKSDFLTLESAANVLKIPLESLLLATDMFQSHIDFPTPKSRFPSPASSYSERTDPTPRSIGSQSPIVRFAFTPPSAKRSADSVPWATPSGGNRALNARAAPQDSKDTESLQPESNSVVSDDLDLSLFDSGNIAEDFPFSSMGISNDQGVFEPEQINWFDPLFDETPTSFLDVESGPMTTDQISPPTSSILERATPINSSSPPPVSHQRHPHKSATPEILALDSCQTGLGNDTSPPTDAEEGKKETTSNGKGAKRKRGPFQSLEKREETSLTRKTGACICCKMHRIRCERDLKKPNGYCKACTQASQRRILWLPCLRYNLPDAELLDHATCPRQSWTRRWKKMEIIKIRDWASPETKAIRITQDVGGASYQVKVRKFTPVEGDALARRWKTNGREQSFLCAPYGIADMREAGETLSKFADRTLGSAISFYVDESDALLRDTYLMAYRYSKFTEREDERLLLAATLRLWCASRMESRSDRICGEETLGMKPQDYGRECPNSGIILTPPVFSAQLEVIVVATILQPAKKEVLKRLRDLILEGRRSWFAIYLSMFILLHSCALLTAAANKKARKQGLESRYLQTPIVQSLHNGAKILLAYFHYCNKGTHPFNLDWSSPDQIAWTEFNAEQAGFMLQTTKEIKKKAPLFKRVLENGEFENDYYFLSQLFESDWKPRETV